MYKIKFFLIIITLFILSSCCYEIEYKSIDEYKERVMTSGFGFYDVEIDHPKYLLPSNNYLDEYSYLEGNYYFYENSPFCDFVMEKHKPNRYLIILKYSENIYYEAKQFVLENIPIYMEKKYSINNYQFYINKNFMDRFDKNDLPQVPKWMTMVGYNDEKSIICFLGFNNSYPKLEDKYLNEFDNNFEDFIVQYYSEYYEFLD